MDAPGEGLNPAPLYGKRGVRREKTLAVSRLQCEARTAPMTVETRRPRLSWITKTDLVGWSQSAYRILVASNLKTLALDQGDLWDSGKVDTEQSLFVRYDGAELTPRQACFWKVKVWGADGTESPWSKPGHWEMGLFEEADWRSSRWIGAPEPGIRFSIDDKSDAPEGILEPPAGQPAPILRKEFAARGRVKRARLYASGLGCADVHMNGKKLGSSLRDPGYTNFDRSVLYVAYDVTSRMRAGVNVLGAILGTGWYDVHDLATWRFEQAPWRGRPRFRAILYIEYADGSLETVVTDESWQTAPSPILRDGIYTGEVFDARLELEDWSSPFALALAWSRAEVKPAPKGVLKERLCGPVVVGQRIKPKKMVEPKQGVYVLDFGQNMSGHVRIRLKGNSGETVRLRYSERVHSSFAIERGEIETYMTVTDSPQPFQTDSYTFRGSEGRTSATSPRLPTHPAGEEWEPTFSTHGFRYVEVTGLEKKPKLDAFEARFTHTEFEDGGEFSCSNELLNQIQHATRAAFLSNAQSIPTDCPQREKNGWTGDAHLACEAGLLNFKSAAFYAKWLDDLAEDQGEEGNLSLIVPTGGWGRGACHPAWDSAYAIIARDLWRYTGDSAPLIRHYRNLCRYVAFLAAKREDGVIPFESLGDWLPWEAETSSQLTSTAFLFLLANILAEAADLQSFEEDAARHRELAAEVREAFLRRFFPAETRMATFESATQTALAISIFFGLLEGADRESAFGCLCQKVESLGYLDTGILGAKYVLRVLSEGGRTDLAYQVVARKEIPGWGWWMEQGATTLWEDWKGENSLNHIMFGDVSNWMISWIAGIGIDFNHPGFKRFTLRPQIVGDLTWAGATVESPYGRIRSSWHRTGNRLRIEIEVPPNTSATFLVPGRLVGHETPAPDESGVPALDLGSGLHTFLCQL